MKSLQLISHLLDYPTDELYGQLQQSKTWLANELDLDANQQPPLLEFIEHYQQLDLLDWQSEYDGLFERGRSLSLLLFEHIHGESRDRGQAMIDLMQQYKQAGLAIDIKELPDYIPLFLEFVATQGEANAQAWLQDVAHILALLQVRLTQRKSHYANLFTVLVSLSKADIDLADLAKQTKNEPRDDTKEAIDKVWEEEMVKFVADDPNCDSSISRPSEGQRRDQQVPIQFVDAAFAQPQPPTKQSFINKPAGVN